MDVWSFACEPCEQTANHPATSLASDAGVAGFGEEGSRWPSQYTIRSSSTNMHKLHLKRSVGCLALLLTAVNTDSFASFEAGLFISKTAMLMLRNQNLHLMAATTVKPGQRQILCCREKAALRITSSASVWAGNKSSVTFPLGYVAGNSIVTSVLAEEAVKSSKFTTLSNIRDVHTGRERSLGRRAAELSRGVSKHLWCRKTMFISAHELTQTLASWRCEPERSRTTSKRDVAAHDSRGERGYRKELC